MKIFFRIIKFLILILAFFTGIIYFVLNTSSGTQLFIQTAKKYVPGQLSIDYVDGVIGSSFTLKNVTYYSPQLQFRLKELNVGWHPLALLHRKLMIDTINVDNLETNVTINKTEMKTADKNKSPNLSFSMFNRINVKHLHITNYNFNKDNQHIYRLESVNLDSHPNHQFDLSLTGTNLLNNEPLKASATFHLAPYEYKLDALQVSASNASLVASGTVNQKWDVKWRLDVPMLTKLYSAASGSFISQGNITGVFNQPIVNANVEGAKLIYQTYRVNHLLAKISSPIKATFEPQLGLQVQGIVLNETRFNQLDLQIKSKRKKNNLDFDLRCDLGNGNSIIGNIILPKNISINDLNRPIKGNLFAKVSKLQTVITAIPNTKNLRGELKAKIDLSGHLNNPTYAVNLTVNNAAIDIPINGVKLYGINLTGELAKDLQLKFSGLFHSGRGLANVNGDIALKEEGYPLALNLQGNDLTVFNTNEYKVIAAPNIDLTYKNSALNVKGDIYIPTANIKPKDFSSTVTLPNEVEFVHKEKIADKNSNLTLNINLELGNQISIAYQNLKASITGKLAIIQQKDSLATATGELHTIKGSYTAYGKSLDITEGHLLYTGNLLTNPGLNIRAIKEIKTIESVSGNTNFYANNELEKMHTMSQLTVGVQVKGSLERPLLSFYSEPNQLSQADIISYIVFGYPQSQINSASSLTVLNSLLAGNSNGKSGIQRATKNIKKTLGLSELKIGNTEYYDPEKQKIASGTSLTIGKKLGKNLSINYTTGIFNSVSVLELRYQINKSLALKSATSSLDTGADLVYEIEE